MNSIKHRFTLDMHSTQSQISIPALIGDTSRSLHINFSDGGTPYFIETGCLAKISIIRPTGTHIEDFCEIVNNSTAVYRFDQNENTCAVEGIHECDVTLYGLEGERIASPRFSMIVSDTVFRSDDLIITDEDRTMLDAILVAEAQRQADEAERVVAEAERVANEEERQQASETILAKAAEVVDLTKTATQAAQTATEKAQIAVESATEATGILAQVGDVLQVRKQVDRNDKRITNLEQGVTPYPFETDESVAYTKIVPPNALPYAEISRVGGMTHKDGHDLVSSPVYFLTISSPNLLPFPYAQMDSVVPGSDNGLRIKGESDGSVTVSGTNGASTVANASLISNDSPLELEAGTYTFNGNQITNDQNAYVVWAIIKDGVTEEYLTGGGARTFDAKRSVWAVVQTRGGTTVNATFKPMVYKGETSLPYSRFRKTTLSLITQEDARKFLFNYGEGIDDKYHNFIKLDDGGAYFYENVKKVSFDGREPWEMIAKGNGVNTFYLPLSYFYDAPKLNTPVLYSNVSSVYYLDNDKLACDFPDRISSIEDWKEALEGWSHNMPFEVVYVRDQHRVVDLKDIVTFDNFIEVFGGGTISFDNVPDNAVPSTITYMLRG